MVVSRLHRSSTLFMMCDMQEKFRPAIHKFSEIIEVARRLISAGKLMNIPLAVSEQYPKGLGSTVSELNEIADGYAKCKLEKTRFSMVVPEMIDYLKTLECDTVVLFGVEAHVCVQQTALDLITMGKKVHVVADATSSRCPSDRKIAFDKLKACGVYITTAESVIFELLGDKNDDMFKPVSALLREKMPDTDL